MNKDFWERIDRLEELAGKATRTDWDIHVTGDNAYATNVDFHQADNLRYIAAANPAMILDLISQFKTYYAGMEHDLVEQNIKLGNEQHANLFLQHDISSLKMDLFTVRHQAQKMAKNNMKYCEQISKIQKELNDAKAKLGDKNRRIQILEEDLSRVKEYSRNSNKIESLEKEADWLAEELASVYKSEFEGTMDLLDASGWREAARKAISEDK